MTSPELVGQGTAHARLLEGLMGGAGHGNVSSSAQETGLSPVFRLIGPLRGAGAGGTASTTTGAGFGGGGHGNVSSSAQETGLSHVFRLIGPLR